VGIKRTLISALLLATAAVLVSGTAPAVGSHGTATSTYFCAC